MDRLVEEECVLVVGLDELVLADAAAEAEDVGHVVLLALQVLRDDLVGLLAVALLVAPVEREGVEVDDGGVLRVVLPVVQRLQVLHQLHHRVVVLDLPETDEHVEDDVSRDYVGVVEAAAHVVQRLGQVLACVRLAQLAQVRQELLLHVNPERSSWFEMELGTSTHLARLLSPFCQTLICPSRIRQTVD